MEIQLHRYIEKAVLEYCYSNPAHQSWACKCCAPVYLTLTTMHLMFSFSFFLLFPPNLTLNHSNCILLEAVCVRSFQSLPHTHTPVWDWPREKSNENQRRGRVMDIYIFAVLKTASHSCKTIISLLEISQPWENAQSPSHSALRTELRLHNEESWTTMHTGLWVKFHDSKFSTSKVICEVPVPTVTTKAISTCLHGSLCLQG